MSLRTGLGVELRQRHWWRTLRRVQAEGAARAFRRWQQWSQVLATAPVYADVPGRSPVELHLLCHRGDHLCAIWALKTLYRTSRLRWPTVVHVQGECTATMTRRFRHHVPDARLIVQSEADARVGEALSDRYPRLFEARRQSPFMMKLIDPVVLGSAERIVILDSDVLFFREPCELRAHVERAPAETWLFQHDPSAPTTSPKAVAASAFGIRHSRTRQQRHRGRSTITRRSSTSASACSSIRTCAGPADGSSRRCSRSVPGRAAVSNTCRPSYVISLDRGLDYGGFTARHLRWTQPPAAHRRRHAVRRASRLSARAPMAKLWALRALWRMFRYLGNWRDVWAAYRTAQPSARPAVQTRLRAQSRTRPTIRSCCCTRCSPDRNTASLARRSQYLVDIGANIGSVDARPCVERSAREG